MEQHSDSPAVAAAPFAASFEADLNPLPQPENALAAAPQTPPPAAPEAPTPATLDAHGFDPGAYQWVPVLRKPRKDGWTPQRQVDFIAALADLGCVEQAARQVGMTDKSCYRLRRAPGAENFAAAWDAAIQHAARTKLVDLAFNRAIHGSDEPVFDKEGYRIGRRMRQNDRLLMFLLRAYMPDRFRHAHRDMRTADEPLPAPPAPMELALRRLEPALPPAPHALMSPDELDVALQCAEIGDGVLPHWHRGRGDAEPAFEHSLGEDIERELEAAKHAVDGPPALDEAGEE